MAMIDYQDFNLKELIESFEHFTGRVDRLLDPVIDIVKTMLNRVENGAKLTKDEEELWEKALVDFASVFKKVSLINDTDMMIMATGE